METFLFYVLGVVTLVSAMCVVFLRRPIHNALFMILTMIGLAGLFMVLHAEFIAMVQLIVYAGAVMVLFLFVIMLLNLERLKLPEDVQGLRRWFGILLAVGMACLVFPALRVVLPGGTAKAVSSGLLQNTDIIARELFTTYLLPFEITSVLLLSAIIGAVILARKRTKQREEG